MALKDALLWLSERPNVFEFIKGNSIARKMAGRFVAGETLDTAIHAVKDINNNDLTATLDLLGESVTSQNDSLEAKQQIVGILHRIGDSGVDANVSMKLTQLGMDIDENLCADNMLALLEHAQQYDIFVRIDMESSAYTERTLKLFAERFFPEFGDLVGVVIQSALRRSPRDVDELIDMNARVRMVKGAYAEPERVAFPDKLDVDDAYGVLSERLLSRGNHPAIATHDEQLIRHLIDYIERNSIPPEDFEFQMLYGIRRDLQNRLRTQGYNVRVYVPFGTQWYPYLMRRMAERPANLTFIVGNIFKETFSWK